MKKSKIEDTVLKTRTVASDSSSGSHPCGMGIDANGKPFRRVSVKVLSPLAKIPTYGTEEAACFDFYAAIDKAVEIPPHGCVNIPTGLAFCLPKGTVMLMYSRSGHGFKSGVRFVNCVGVIDSDYRGEVRVGLRNDFDVPYTVTPKERIAQGIVQSCMRTVFEQVETLPETARGTGGFGSTGIN